MAEKKSELNHIGYIVDGNRRWAKLNGVSEDVHRKGRDVVFDIAKKSFESGVKYATFFVFSTENWQRSHEEVSYLMNLFVESIHEQVSELVKNNIKLLFLGTKERVDPEVLSAMNDAEEQTKGCTGGTMSLCFNYGGHREIADAVKNILVSGIGVEDISEQTIYDNLYHPEVPPVDITVRTGGELRVSNFMLWRIAYSELMFIDKLWPEMTVDDVDAIIAEYARRNRRFGR